MIKTQYSGKSLQRKHKKECNGRFVCVVFFKRKKKRRRPLKTKNRGGVCSFGATSHVELRNALSSPLLWPIFSRQRAKVHCWLTLLSWPRLWRDPNIMPDRYLVQPLSSLSYRWWGTSVRCYIHFFPPYLFQTSCLRPRAHRFSGHWWFGKKKKLEAFRHIKLLGINSFH